MKKMIFTAVAFLALAGCASLEPTPAEMMTVDYGSPISQGDAEKLAEARFKAHMKDPYSAVFEWQPITTGWISESRLHGGRKHFGYYLHGTVNGKNSYGAYVGLRQVAVIFRNGVIDTATWEVPMGYGNTTIMQPVN